ncbi:ABC transporter permease [Sciscionella marina]|uniref:ABC transporter permease n=1 Tax=Sciscionella marina TaxID=508770 RepID=UPI00036FCD55|nr:ABC transporter permease [Sciscionella marina]
MDNRSPTLGRPDADDPALAQLRTVLTARPRPPRPGPLTTSLVFGWRTLLRIKHLPEQMIDVTAFPIMLTLMFTFLFGGAIAGSTTEYVQFLQPGILVQTIVMITMTTGSSLNSDVVSGVFDRFRSLSIWQPAVLVGALIGDAVRYLLGAVIVLVLSLILGFRPEGGFLGVLAGVALVLIFSFSLGWLWTMLGLLLRTPQSVTSLSMFVMLPLTFASNIFVDPKTMPGWLESVVGCNPITHLTAAVRAAMQGTLTSGQTGVVLLWCAGLVGVFAPLTMRLYRTKH